MSINQLNRRALDALPTTFRYSRARRVLNERQLRSLLEAGLIERVSWGAYRKTDVADGDLDLEEISVKAPLATLCLRSALARHNLTDEIPPRYDVALPRRTWEPATRAPVTWHQFDAITFDVGRAPLSLGGEAAIGLYGAERSIVDAYRLRHFEGPELANEALRRWLRHGGQPSALLTMAARFPAALPALRNALEVLL
ncbi:MAG TPA: hypothetical protein VFJ19_01435 [Nocardioidaceae bacterium]|nr:hypothetical protein [Nocardioidaceae bacterium]